jgi:hypothetical protein
MAFDPRYADAISGIESGGRYGLLGPVTKSGDQAYGKYQVMGANVPQWTQQYYGQSLTPQQFLANPQAQDAVFQGKFGQYAQKYGPEGAAKAWFAGEKGMNNPNAKDMLGTTVDAYGKKFAAGLGPDYASVNSAPLTPGTQAPPLPPAINIGSQPQTPASAPMMAAAPQQQQQQSPGFNPMAMSSLMGGMGSGQQAPQAPPLSQNPIQAMAMFQPPPNTQGLQQLLKNSPALRGLLV